MTDKNKKKPGISKRGPGRPEKTEKTVSVHWRVPAYLHSLIEHERKKQEFAAGRKVPKSKVLEMCVKKVLG